MVTSLVSFLGRTFCTRKFSESIVATGQSKFVNVRERWNT